MTDKVFFDECPARCVNLSPQEEEWTSSFSGNGKMYTSGNIANSQRMVAETNEGGAKAKIRILVESDTLKH